MKGDPLEPMMPDYRLSQFYAEANDSSSSADAPIYAEILEVTDRYSSPQVIATGGLKKILRVHDHKTGRDVAMAQLRPEAPQEMFEPFLREARLTAQLEHPNIIAVTDIGVSSDGRPFFTMELKEHDSLGAIVDQLAAGDTDYLARHDRQVLLGIFIKICDAVAYAHSRQVLHLDLKPDNVQVGDFGEVIVCDWGLGKILGTEQEIEFDELLLNPDLLNHMTLSGTIRGTPGYMAPEQVDGLEKTKQTDIYALGAILHAVLSHVAPLDGTKEEILEKTRQGEIQSPRKRFPALDIPQSLDAVVMKAMARNPAERYESVDGLSREVRGYLSGFATSAERAGLGKQLQLLYLRNRRFCLTLTGGAVVVSMVTLLAIRQLQVKERLASDARDRAELTLSLYLQEKEHTEQLTDDYLADLIDVNRQFILKQEFNTALAKIEQATLKDPRNLKAWLEKGYTLFMMQQYQAAAKSFETAKELGTTYQLAREYGARRPDGQIMPGAEFAELIRRVERYPLRVKMLMFDSAVRKDRNEHALIVRASLEAINPEWTDGRFEYDPVAHSLILSGKGLRDLGNGTSNSIKSVLVTLDLRQLDLRNTEFSNLRNIRNLNLERLDLRDTLVSDLEIINHMRQLQTLIVSPGQFPSEVIERLAKRIDIQVME